MALKIVAEVARAILILRCAIPQATLGVSCRHAQMSDCFRGGDRETRAYGLIRINRPVLVNAAFVEGIRSSSTGEYGLQIKGGKEFTVTRTYKKNLKFLAKFWIGTGGFFSG
jgi:hypothetical protein